MSCQPILSAGASICLVLGSNFKTRPRLRTLATLGLLSLAVGRRLQSVLMPFFVAVLDLSPILLAVDRDDKLRIGAFMFEVFTQFGVV